MEGFDSQVKKFLSEGSGDNDEKYFAAFQASFGSIMMILKEVRDYNQGQMIESCLEQLYDILFSSSKGAFIKEASKSSMIIDMNLNKARKFMVELIVEQKSSKRVF